MLSAHHTPVRALQQLACYQLAATGAARLQGVQRVGCGQCSGYGVVTVVRILGPVGARACGGARQTDVRQLLDVPRRIPRRHEARLRHQDRGTQFTFFTSTKLHILTQQRTQWYGPTHGTMFAVRYKYNLLENKVTPVSNLFESRIRRRIRRRTRRRIRRLIRRPSVGGFCRIFATALNFQEIMPCECLAIAIDLLNLI